MIKGAYNITNKRLARGYAFNPEDKEQLLNICLFVDGEQMVCTENNELNKFTLKKNFHPTGNCGFSFVLPSEADFPQNYKQVEIAPLGKGNPLDIVHFPPEFNSLLNPQKRIAMLHIPKTAGSSLNKLFASQYDGNAKTQFHAEGTSWYKSKKLNAVGNHVFFSGHIPLPVFIQLCRKQFFFRTTVLRKPIDHLKSHIRWVIKISEDMDSSFFKSHPKGIQELSLHLRKIDFGDPQQINKWINNLSTLETRLFQNCQTRYLIKNRNNINITATHSEEAIQNLGKFHLVGIMERLQNYLTEIDRVFAWNTCEKIENENANPSYYGLDKTSNEIDSLLSALIEMDNSIYEHVKRNMAP